MFIYCVSYHFRIHNVCHLTAESVASPAMGTGARAPSIFNNFIFSSLWTKSESLESIVQSARLAGADVNNSQLFRSVLHQSQNY